MTTTKKQLQEELDIAISALAEKDLDNKMLEMRVEKLKDELDSTEQLQSIIRRNYKDLEDTNSELNTRVNVLTFVIIIACISVSLLVSFF